jgi:hypothetical protein
MKSLRLGLALVLGLASAAQAVNPRLSCVGWEAEVCDYFECCRADCNSCFFYDSQGNLIRESHRCGEFICRPGQS